MFNIINGLRGEGGNQPEFVVKLVSEIANDQQTRTCDQTFEGIPDPNRPPVPPVQPLALPYLVNFWPNYAKSPQHAQIPYALLVASKPLNSHII